jgi:hypothetical protein
MVTVAKEQVREGKATFKRWDSTKHAQIQIKCLRVGLSTAVSGRDHLQCEEDFIKMKTGYTIHRGGKACMHAESYVASKRDNQSRHNESSIYIV